MPTNENVSLNYPNGTLNDLGMLLLRASKSYNELGLTLDSALELRLANRLKSTGMCFINRHPAANFAWCPNKSLRKKRYLTITQVGSNRLKAALKVSKKAAKR